MLLKHFPEVKEIHTLIICKILPLIECSSRTILNGTKLKFGRILLSPFIILFVISQIAMLHEATISLSTVLPVANDVVQL